MNKLKHSATAELILKTVLFGSEDKSSKHLVSSDARHLSREIAYHVIRYPEVFLFAIKNRFIRWSIRLFEKYSIKVLFFTLFQEKLYRKTGLGRTTEGLYPDCYYWSWI